MNRRTVLASLGSAATVSIVGCARVGSIPSPDTDRRVVELESVDEVPAEHEVKIDVELIEPSINADHTARLAVSTTNIGEHRTIPIASGTCSLFNRRRGESDHPQGLWLHRAGSKSHIDREGDRWVADRPSDQPRVFHDYGCSWAPYGPGDTVTNEYEIWDNYRVAGYMALGTYRWKENVRMFSADNGEVEDDEEQIGSFHWGFEIELGVPGDA